MPRCAVDPACAGEQTPPFRGIRVYPETLQTAPRWGRRPRAWRCRAAWWTRRARRASRHSRLATARRCRPGRTPSGASSGAWARARRARASRSSTRRPSSPPVRTPRQTLFRVCHPPGFWSCETQLLTPGTSFCCPVAMYLEAAVYFLTCAPAHPHQLHFNVGYSMLRLTLAVCQCL